MSREEMGVLGLAIRKFFQFIHSGISVITPFSFKMEVVHP